VKAVEAAQSSEICLVVCAYAALDVFGGRDEDLLTWAKALPERGTAANTAPRGFDSASSMALQRALRRGEVIDSRGDIDAKELLRFRELVKLLPYLRAEERRRILDPKPQVVFTLPEGLQLPDADVHLARSLTVRLSEALNSATVEPVLLASPFWSSSGTTILRPSLSRAIKLGLPITLAGACAPAEGQIYDHLAAMCRFATQLRRDGASVVCLQYRPPFPSSLFHAKVACGRIGYLGSGNFTDHALDKNVEAGVPLQPADVSRVWWLIQVLCRAKLLVEVE